MERLSALVLVWYSTESPRQLRDLMLSRATVGLELWCVGTAPSRIAPEAYDYLVLCA
jgi:hypothetical protein